MRFFSGNTFTLLEVLCDIFKNSDFKMTKFFQVQNSTWYDYYPVYIIRNKIKSLTV